MTKWWALLALAGCANAADERPDAARIDAAVPDVAVPDAAPACTLFPNLGCDGGGACDVSATTGVACRAVGTGTETSTCTAAECAARYTCLSANGLGSSCVMMCMDDAPCAGPAGICALAVAPGVMGCSQACNPLGSSGCPSGWACQLEKQTGGTRFYTRCTTAGLGGQTAACTKEEDCLAGYNCSPGNVCLARCVLGQTGGCSAFSGTACTALSTHPKIGTTEYGVCHN